MQLNTKADDLATKGVQDSQNELVFKEVLSATKLGIKDREGRDVDDLRGYLTKRTNGQELIDYYKKRQGWDKNLLKTIDWEGLSCEC